MCWTAASPVFHSQENWSSGGTPPPPHTHTLLRLGILVWAPHRDQGACVPLFGSQWLKAKRRSRPGIPFLPSPTLPLFISGTLVWGMGRGECLLLPSPSCPIYGRSRKSYPPCFLQTWLTLVWRHGSTSWLLSSAQDWEEARSSCFLCSSQTRWPRSSEGMRSPSVQLNSS